MNKNDLKEPNINSGILNDNKGSKRFTRIQQQTQAVRRFSKLKDKVNRGYQTLKRKGNEENEQFKNCWG